MECRSVIKQTGHFTSDNLLATKNIYISHNMIFATKKMDHCISIQIN